MTGWHRCKSIVDIRICVASIALGDIVDCLSTILVECTGIDPTLFQLLIVLHRLGSFDQLDWLVEDILIEPFGGVRHPSRLYDLCNVCRNQVTHLLHYVYVLHLDILVLRLLLLLTIVAGSIDIHIGRFLLLRHLACTLD